MIRFVFGVHIHQPVGNFDHVFASAYENCYLPFLKAISNHPSIKFCLHTTGPLYQWMEQNKPDWFEILGKMIEAGQVEIMGGGFYEPILSVIPREDSIGQIEMMSDYIENRFGVRPRGMWTAERIWEPGLPSIMAEAGMDHTVLDDTHFRWAGLKENDLFGYYITEDQGLPVCVFPISKFLRYSIPFQPPSDTIDFLKKLYDERGDLVVVYADDGEKFGVWPGTHNTCYNERWLEHFFHQLTQNLGWIKPVFFTEALDEIPALGRVYLPTSSYAEMGQWSLPADGFGDYEKVEGIFKADKLWNDYGYLIRGGFWRNFLSKYPEANNMHKKMLHLTQSIRAASGRKDADRDILARAIDLKWQGQCNCPYWHGIFGGLYLNHLRHATYSRFIEAESLLEDHSDDRMVEGEILDFDVDGREEVLLKSRHLNIYISPSSGGSIFELDYKPAFMNLVDTMTRRREGYHSRLTEAKEADDSEGGSIHDRIETKEKGLGEYLIYDWYRRASLLDHFFNSDVNTEMFARNDYKELGDFVDQPFSAELVKKEDRVALAMARDGHIWVGKIWAPVVLGKLLILYADSARFDVLYRIDNRSKEKLSMSFGVETAWAMLAGNSPDRFYHVNGSKPNNSAMISSGVTPSSETISIRDEAFNYVVNIRTDRKLDWWRFPIETISLSEGGFERNYQQSTVMPVMGLDLEPGGSTGLLLSVRIDKIE
jgi:alpha-amylase/alpha-mannosidase (GH57 family)